MTANIQKGFKISSDGGNGFSIGFQNNLTLAVQFDSVHYCSQYKDGTGAYTAECVVWKTDSLKPDGSREWMTKHFFDIRYDDVMPQVTPEELAGVISSIALWRE